MKLPRDSRIRVISKTVALPHHTLLFVLFGLQVEGYPMLNDADHHLAMNQTVLITDC
jgi:hypothetical protein